MSERARYQLAERLLPGNAQRLIVGGEATPRFVKATDRFHFVERTATGERRSLVDPDAGTCVAASADGRDSLGPEWSVSPDDHWGVRTVDGNINLLDRETGTERQVTHDGTPAHAYGARLDWLALQRQLRGVECDPLVVWSADSSRVVIERPDQSDVAETHLLQLVADDPRPRLHTFRNALPGDAQVATSQLYILEVASGVITPVQMEPPPIALFPLVLQGNLWFSPSGERLEAIVQSRDQRSIRLLAIDPGTGLARTVVEEHRDTWIDPKRLWLDPTERPAARVLDDGRALWVSERDGWAHLWLVDGADWHQLTRGEWILRELLHVDEQRGELLFTASGRERDGGIVDRRLYRLALDGGEPELLTPEPTDHAITVAPSGRWLIDCHSSPQVPPTTILRRAQDGAPAQELARADTTELLKAGWRAPERFTVLSADGETELHGVLYLPPGFDEGGSWPLLDVIYPGPQMGVVPRRFGLSEDFHFESLAALGLVVMALDARGTPLRSRAFHEASFGTLESTPAIADHVAAVGQLTGRYPTLDASRVGITGASGGGYISVRALIEAPETFTVCVASVGNYDNRRYQAGWGERYIGVIEQNPEAWVRQSDVHLASGVRGRLLLQLSEIDANVSPTNTRALIAALVEADIDHDVVVLPHGDHHSVDSAYFIRRMWDYFTRHLVGAEPPAYSIAPESLRGPEHLLP